MVVIALIISTKVLVLSKPAVPKAITINTKGQPTLGNPAAPVRIVAFEDLKCPNCARFNNVNPTRLKIGQPPPRVLQFVSNSVPQSNMKQLSNCTFSTYYSNALQKNLKIVEKIMNPVATPAIYVNGINVEPLTQKSLEALIKGALSRAKN